MICIFTLLNASLSIESRLGDWWNDELQAAATPKIFNIIKTQVYGIDSFFDYSLNDWFFYLLIDWYTDR